MNHIIEKIKTSPENLSFAEVIATVDLYYDFSPTKFVNGELINEAGQNSGSCKVFSFAKLNNLDKEQTLTCFGDYYRKDVLENPLATDHQNIRNFMKYGWEGIRFDNEALTLKF